MAIQNYSDEIIFVNLSGEHETRPELEVVIGGVVRDNSRHVLLDFSNVDFITSSCCTCLLKLHKLLSNSGNHLVFCNVNILTQGIFGTLGLENIFDFTTDKDSGILKIQEQTTTGCTFSIVSD